VGGFHSPWSISISSSSSSRRWGPPQQQPPEAPTPAAAAAAAGAGQGGGRHAESDGQHQLLRRQHHHHHTHLGGWGAGWGTRLAWCPDQPAGSGPTAAGGGAQLMQHGTATSCCAIQQLLVGMPSLHFQAACSSRRGRCWGPCHLTPQQQHQQQAPRLFGGRGGSINVRTMVTAHCGVAGSRLPAWMDSIKGTVFDKPMQPSACNHKRYARILMTHTWGQGWRAGGGRASTPAPPPPPCPYVAAGSRGGAGRREWWHAASGH
jgi:hypothetical protein